ncbi:alpha/beta hydrolase [Piscinibacter sp. XHJ-5]|uniref:alpha/beta fold hydrolase n=1 Tax=Piscinibacter sp. XHJ-5 TaxID=3037797 RepID=UPI002452DE80|nr:alpha/beta hydrolase [Piscinibacter sp. XHJ-5]
MTQEIPRTPEAFASANGLRLCYQTFGDPAHPPMVLIMGMGAQMVGWDEDFCEMLAGRGFWVIRFDNRDAGRSTNFHHAGMPDVASALTRAWMRLPVTAPYLLDDMALDVAGLMDALHIEEAHLVGASMGGGIAQALAIRRPQRVLSLTSIMSTTGDPALPSPQPSAMAAVFKPPPNDVRGYVAQYVQTWKVLRAGEFPEEEARDRARAARNHERGLNPGGAARQLVAILASGSRRQALRRVVAPTMVIHGDADPLVPLAAGEDTARHIPGADLLVLEGMGHAMPMRFWPRIVEGIVQVAR